jgi:hypothetical protein
MNIISAMSLDPDPMLRAPQINWNGGLAKPHCDQSFTMANKIKFLRPACINKLSILRFDEDVQLLVVYIDIPV